jgi:enoyl-CoA hydratase
MTDVLADRKNTPGYEQFNEGLIVERDEDGVLLVTLNRPHALNATTYAMHSQLVELWAHVAKDKETKLVVVTGAGRGFCSGADLKEARARPLSHGELLDLMDEGAAMVWNMINLDKPIISAINGPAVGSGAALALLADISVAAEDAKIFDGHTTVGVVSGDHSVLIWPLLCGMAKAKYYLLTNEPLTGREAERIGLVTFAVPTEDVLPRALEIARKLAGMSQSALRGTKHTLNHWLRLAGPAFEHSLALEMLGYYGRDINEARAAFEEKRQPQWSE